MIVIYETVGVGRDSNNYGLNSGAVDITILEWKPSEAIYITDKRANWRIVTPFIIHKSTDI